MFKLTITECLFCKIQITCELKFKTHANPKKSFVKIYNIIIKLFGAAYIYLISEKIQKKIIFFMKINIQQFKLLTFYSHRF